MVEDDGALGALLEEEVVAQGWTCERAADGAAALQSIVMARREPGLVLLDLSLPHMDGEALALEIRRLLGKHVPIVIVSGRPRDQLNSVARRIHATILPKPFELDQLEAVLAGHLTPAPPPAKSGGELQRA